MEITREQHFEMYKAIVTVLSETTDGLENEEIYDLATEILARITKNLNLTIKNESFEELLTFVMSLVE